MIVRAAALAGLALALLAADARAQPAPPSPRRPRAAPGKKRPPPPPAAEAGCPDPITGTWQTTVWRDDSGVWDRVTLRITRRGPQLSGWIFVESWDGDATQREPPTCPDGTPARERWRERLTGSYLDGVVDLRGSRVVKLDDVCAPGGDASSYRPDHFTGARAATGDALVTTNDDGGADRGRPHPFRRTSCQP